MKKGKSCELKGYKNFKCRYGTVDSKNLKSIYLNLQTWVQPISDELNWDRHVSILLKNIKSTINELIDTLIFETKIIVDLDLRTSGISINKKSFMNLEVTFFVKKQLDFKSQEVKNFIKKIIEGIEKDNFKYNRCFTFHLTKTIKSQKTVKIENK